MACAREHNEHGHVHGPECGHTTIRQGAETGYLHDGHMHVAHEEHFDCSSVAVTNRNPDRCTPEHKCGEHGSEHRHGPNCGHERVPHGDHADYLVGGHLHHEHGGHCDDHGPVDVHVGARAA